MFDDRASVSDPNGQRVVWYPPYANKPGTGGNNTLDQVRGRYQEMKNTNSMAEIAAVLTNWASSPFIASSKAMTSHYTTCHTNSCVDSASPES